MGKHTGGLISYLEWCPVCERSQPTLKKLSAHMKEKHNRLILDKDINQQTYQRALRLREFQATEDALLS